MSICKIDEAAELFSRGRIARRIVRRTKIDDAVVVHFCQIGKKIIFRRARKIAYAFVCAVMCRARRTDEHRSVDIHGICGILHGDAHSASEQKLYARNIAFCTVGYEHFIGFRNARIKGFGDFFAEFKKPLFVAVTRITFGSRKGARIVRHRVRNMRLERLRRIADAQTDELRIGVRSRVSFTPARNFGKEIARGEIGKASVSFYHNRILANRAKQCNKTQNGKSYAWSAAEMQRRRSDTNACNKTAKRTQTKPQAGR